MRRAQEAGDDALSAVTQRPTKAPFGDGISGMPERALEHSPQGDIESSTPIQERPSGSSNFYTREICS